MLVVSVCCPLLWPFERLHSSEHVSPAGVSSFLQDVFFYIALYNGDVFVQYSQGAGLSEPLRTRGLWYADGFEHHVTVDFSTRNR